MPSRSLTKPKTSNKPATKPPARSAQVIAL